MNWICSILFVLGIINTFFLYGAIIFSGKITREEEKKEKKRMGEGE